VHVDVSIRLGYSFTRVDKICSELILLRTLIEREFSRSYNSVLYACAIRDFHNVFIDKVKVSIASFIMQPKSQYYHKFDVDNRPNTVVILYKKQQKS